MAAPQLSYVPAPYEQPYYEGLFHTADVARGGNIGGAEAVAFFSRSKLTIETLKSIWTIADTGPTTNTLDRRKFAIAIRLIQLAQNGVKAQGATLGGPPGLRPAMFEGVSGVNVQLPPPEPAGGGAPEPAAGSPQQQPQYGQPPPSPQSQYGQPPARAATPTPPQQQQQYSAPPTPTRPPVAVGPPPSMSMAMTPQDPYTMTPQEQARYESIFPNYATPEGFVGGKEAVELFSKSGVDPAALGKIWNMVDTPVDNKLDKLEFAMAMHLIVCISKKNLPLPTALPISMKSLKSQQAPAPGALAALAMPTMNQDEAPPALVAPPSIMSSASSVGAGSFGGGEPPQQQFSVPPPLPASGAGSLSISDAFEGLDAGDSAAAQGGYGTGAGPPPLPPQQQQHDQYAYGGAAGAMAAAVAVETIPEPQPEMSMPEPQQQFMEPVEPPKTSQALASSYTMGDDSSELAKLKITLQKLQAENIALKAQMGSMTQEEKDVQKETVATVAEIGKLSVELSDLRAQVLTSKSRLLESTAELAAAKEKKSVMTDLIDETKATNDAMEAAQHDIQDASQQARAAPAPLPAPVAEEDLFGGWGSPAPAQAYSEAPDPWGAPAPDTAAPAPWGAPVVESASQDSDDGMAYGAAEAPVAAYGAASAFGAPAPAPEVLTEQFGQQVNVSSGYDNGSMGGAPAPAAYSAPPPAANSYAAPPPIVTAPSRDNMDSMKQLAMAADQSTREAEDTYRAVFSEAEKLKKVADAAEADARAKQDKADKKRGLGKKKLAKDAELAAIHAADKKRHYLELQAHASNAQGLVAQSRRDAEKMRHEAEQAELDFVAAESTRDSQPHASQAPAAAPAPSYGSNGGGMPDPSQMSQQAYYGAPPAQGYGIAPSNAAPVVNSGPPYGNGTLAPHQRQQSDDSFSFGSGIMGGGQGAISIPTPQANDNYNNPF